MNLFEVSTGRNLSAKINTAKDTDFGELGTSFLFDWRKEQNHDVYKIYLQDEKKIVGMVSLEDIPHELRVHIRLIESAIENTGKQKKIRNIPGCLIAFACEKSFEKGYDGFVSLFPKTKLIKHYIQEYGFRHFGRMLGVEGKTAKNLVLTYLNDDE